MARPIDNKYPRWASDGTNNIEPSEGEKDTGWPPGDVPPAQYENWRSNTAYNWVQYYDETINGFSAQENDPPDLSVVINEGVLRYGQQGILGVPQQTSDPFVAPVTFPKIVGTLINRQTGALLNAEGAEAPVPVPPAIPDGYFTIYFVELSVGQTEIVNDDINELRANFETLSPEVDKVIEDSGQTPDPTEVDQLSLSIGNLSSSSTLLINSNYNTDKPDSGRLLSCDSSGGDITISLQDPSLVGDRFSLIVKKIHEEGLVTIATFSGLIDGKPSITLKPENSAIRIISDGVSSYNVVSNFSGDSRNILVGGNISTNLFQSGTSTTSSTTPPNNNNVYVADQWVLQSDGNNIVNVSRTGGSVLSSVVVTANSKWGFLIPIEGDIYRRLDGQVCSIGCEIQNTSGTISNARIALLSSGGGATTDIVSTWNASGIDPTLNAPWTYQNITQDKPLTISQPTLITAENILVSANPPNIGGVFVWIDDDDASIADEIQIRRISLIKSPVFTGFQEEGVDGILAQYRYYQTTYNPGVRPGTITDVGRVTYMQPSAENALDGLCIHPTIGLRATPSVSFFSPVTGDSGVVAGDNEINRTVTGVDGTGQFSSGRPSISGGQSDNDVYKAHIVLNARL